MKFYLGTHKVAQHWWEHRVPLFVSRRTLSGRKTLPQARSGWALDSGGFTELEKYHRWQTTALEYASDVTRFQQEIGHLEWVAPQDWMCEPFMLAKTGLSVGEHQRRTVDNFLKLRDMLGELVVPVLQGWTLDDYLYCIERYELEGVFLYDDEPIVGLGSVCRRQNTSEAGVIVRRLASEGLRLHYFGAKVTGLDRFHDVLTSADSLAWSYQARREHPMAGCHHKACSNCSRYALRWRARLLQRMDQLQLEVAV